MPAFYLNSRLQVNNIRNRSILIETMNEINDSLEHY